MNNRPINNPGKMQINFNGNDFLNFTRNDGSKERKTINDFIGWTKSAKLKPTGFYENEHYKVYEYESQLFQINYRDKDGNNFTANQQISISISKQYEPKYKNLVDHLDTLSARYRIHNYREYKAAKRVLKKEQNRKKAISLIAGGIALTMVAIGGVAINALDKYDAEHGVKLPPDPNGNPNPYMVQQEQIESQKAAEELEKKLVFDNQEETTEIEKISEEYGNRYTR